MRNWMPEQSLLFTGCSSIQFFNSPPFPNTVTQDTFGTLPLTVQYLCDLKDAMPHHCSLSTSNPTVPREVEDFPRDCKYPKDVSLPTFLFATSLINNYGFIFVSKSSIFLRVVKRLANQQFKAVNLLQLFKKCHSF